MSEIKAHISRPIHFPLYLPLSAMIRDDAELLEAAFRLHVSPSTLRKILADRPVSSYIEAKIRSGLRHCLLSENPIRVSPVQKLLEINRLYEKEGTLRAVGRKIGVSRERVRQLLSKGAEMGLFSYPPRRRLAVSREKILDDYKRYLKLSLVAKVNHVSLSYLKRLRAAYRIEKKELAVLRSAARRCRCVDAYRSIVKDLGRDPTATELRYLRQGRRLQTNIRKLWGSFAAFRRSLGIPFPTLSTRNRTLKRVNGVGHGPRRARHRLRSQGIEYPQTEMKSS